MTFNKLNLPALPFLPNILAITLATFAAACSSPTLESSARSARPENAIRLATYNVHYIWLEKESGSWSVADWERRREPLQSAFTTINADVIAFQEMESFSRGNNTGENLTLSWLTKKNPDYSAGAVGDWRKFPSTQPIFYKTELFDLLDQGWFFFSETPDTIYSRTFNGSYPAFCSWVSLRHKITGQIFSVYNLHLEFKSRSNRLKSIELVVDRVTPRLEKAEQIFIVGDFNDSLKARTVKMIETAGLNFVPVQGSTYHWNRGINLTRAIDHISHTSGIKPAGAPVVLRNKFMDEWPTDHYPVISDFYLP